MSKKALEDTKYELIKSHLIDPDSSPLSTEHQVLLDRIISASKVLDKNPIQKQAVALHRAKYTNISLSQAYEDIKLAMRMYNTLYTFDFDFWKTWLINDIVKNIEKARNIGSHQALKVIAIEHANMIKAIGEKPENLEDPLRNEKNSFFILVQNNNSTSIKLDINNLHKLPDASLRELNKALFAGKEISITDAEEEMKV
ncbi:MAG: hypothetical protein NTZ33_06245 [Bacteroidetes bacterium]|nr:hypothetical protein [Bacteroidota bacterium]